MENKLNLAQDKLKESKKKISDLESNLLIEKSEQDKLKKQCEKLEKTIVNRD